MKACEYEYIYREEGRKAGLAEGEKLGIDRASYGFIALQRKNNRTDDEIIIDLQSVLGISQEEAQEILDNYDKQ